MSLSGHHGCRKQNTFLTSASELPMELAAHCKIEFQNSARFRSAITEFFHRCPFTCPFPSFHWPSPRSSRRPRNRGRRHPLRPRRIQHCGRTSAAGSGGQTTLCCPQYSPGGKPVSIIGNPKVLLARPRSFERECSSATARARASTSSASAAVSDRHPVPGRRVSRPVDAATIFRAYSPLLSCGALEIAQLSVASGE